MVRLDASQLVVSKESRKPQRTQRRFQSSFKLFCLPPNLSIISFIASGGNGFFFCIGRLACRFTAATMFLQKSLSIGLRVLPAWSHFSAALVTQTDEAELTFRDLTCMYIATTESL
jgi:hypothetical protein